LGRIVKAKLELMSNLSETLPVNNKFVCVYIFLFSLKDILTDIYCLSLVSLSWCRITD